MNTPYSMTAMASSTRPPVTIFGIARTASAALAPDGCTRSDRGGGDQVPELAVLLLVLRPDLFLRQLPERRVVRHVHGHAEGFEHLLRLGERIDAFGVLAHDRLRLAGAIQHQLLLVGTERVPHAEVHRDQRRAIVVAG